MELFATILSVIAVVKVTMLILDVRFNITKIGVDHWYKRVCTVLTLILIVGFGIYVSIDFSQWISGSGG